jgi:hypothetical protein
LITAPFGSGTKKRRNPHSSSGVDDLGSSAVSTFVHGVNIVRFDRHVRMDVGCGRAVFGDVLR